MKKTLKKILWLLFIVVTVLLMGMIGIFIRFLTADPVYGRVPDDMTVYISPLTTYYGEVTTDIGEMTVEP